MIYLDDYISKSMTSYCIAFYMTELKICRPDMFQFRFKT